MRAVPPKIPIAKPLFGPEELEALRVPLESGWVVQGPCVRRFEEAFAAFSGATHAAAASSCTTALHLAVTALGLEPGDEVIVPAFTWVATANVVEYQGARPVFCDVDPATWNLDAARVEALIGPRTVGVIPVHLFGLCAPMAPLVELARRRGLWVVEDAACAFGARQGGRHAGTFGDAGCFSFHPRKAITTGEGGMVTTARPELDQAVRSLRDHGASRSDHERHGAAGAFLLPRFDRVGFNYRMTDLQGALGCAQMNRAAYILAERRRLAARYQELLADVPWLEVPRAPAGDEHAWQAFVCLFRPEGGRPGLDQVDRLHARRNALMARLEARGISTRQGTHAPVLTDVYRDKYGLRREDFPGAVVGELLSLALPLWVPMSEEEQLTVVRELRAAFEG